MDLYKRDKGKGSGLALVPKLTFEHIELTKMRVDLATQVYFSWLMYYSCCIFSCRF